ncbi:hypothetical protein C3L33_21877, partial [Rhododendron williamsianum]
MSSLSSFAAISTPPPPLKRAASFPCRPSLHFPFPSNNRFDAFMGENDVDVSHSGCSFCRFGVKCSYAKASTKEDTNSSTIDVIADVKPERVVVLGGSGFVGSAICKAAVSQGIEVMSLSRCWNVYAQYHAFIKLGVRASFLHRSMGRSGHLDARHVVFRDVFYANWDEVLPGATAVVSTIGGFGSEEQMQRINGEANVVAVTAAKDYGILEEWQTFYLEDIATIKSDVWEIKALLEKLTFALLGGAYEAYKVDHVLEEVTQIDYEHTAVHEGIQQTKAEFDIAVKEGMSEHSGEDLPLKEVIRVNNTSAHSGEDLPLKEVIRVNNTSAVYAFSGMENVHIEFVISHKFDGANGQMKICIPVFLSGIPKFIFISVHDYNLPSFLLSSGYFTGKRKAESEVLSKYPTSGVVLRPGLIYGKRRVDGFEIPLDLIGQPLERFLSATENFTKPLSSLPGSDLFLAPPVSVDDVALAAINGVVDDDFFGVFTIEQIKEAATKVRV